MIRFRFIVWLSVTIFTLLSASTKLRDFVHIIIIFLLIMPLFALLHLWYSKRHLALKITRKQNTLQRNEIGTWELVIHNTDNFNTIQLIQTKKSYVLMARHTFHLPYEAKAEHIGYLYPKIDSELKIVDFFGFFTRKLIIPQPQPIPVVPFTNSVHAMDISQSQKENQPLLQAFTFSSDEDEVESINPLAPGHPLRRIHWKISARLQEWMVKKYEYQSSFRLAIFLEMNYFRHLKMRDQYLDFIATLVKESIRANIPVTLFGGNQPFIVDNLESVLLFLSKLDPEETALLSRLLPMYLSRDHFNLIVLSDVHHDNYKALLDYETYFDTMHAIQFRSFLSLEKVPLSLATLSLTDLEYDDA